MNQRKVSNNTRLISKEILENYLMDNYQSLVKWNKECKNKFQKFCESIL